MILNSRLSTEAGPQKTSSSNCMSIISYRTSIIYHISCTVLVLYCTALRWNLGKISSRFKSGLKPVQTPVDLYWYTDCIVITHDSSKGPPPPPPPTHPHHPTDDGMYSITGRYIKKKESKSNQPMLNRIRVRKATPVKGKFLLLLSFFFFLYLDGYVRKGQLRLEHLYLYVDVVTGDDDEDVICFDHFLRQNASFLFIINHSQ